MQLTRACAECTSVVSALPAEMIDLLRTGMRTHGNGKKGFVAKVARWFKRDEVRARPRSWGR